MYSRELELKLRYQQLINMLISMERCFTQEGVHKVNENQIQKLAIQGCLKRQLTSLMNPTRKVVEVHTLQAINDKSTCLQK